MLRIYFVVMIVLVLFSHSNAQDNEIKPGDIIAITVYGHEEFSKTVIVDERGTIDYPFLNEVPVDGISTEKLQEIIFSRLVRYMTSSPVVIVQLVKSYPIKVTVLGLVNKPGTYEIPNIAGLFEAITLAGGFAPGADIQRVQIICPKSGKKQIYALDMFEYYDLTEIGNHSVLKNEDVIIVPGNPVDMYVRIDGAVKSPGRYEITYNTNILDVLFMAGGPAEEANLNKIKILSKTKTTIIVTNFNIERALTAKTYPTLPKVNPGDIVYVPHRKITWRKIEIVLRDIAALATVYLVYHYTRDDF
jgi:polysaccharide biosynthesis/export protein